jgi:hypothetical protein
MTQTARILLLALLTSLALGLFLVAYGPVAAAQSFTVRLVPRDTAFPTGSQAVIAVRVEGQTTALPSFDYAIEGGTIAGILPPNPTAANVAEGAVFVTRATAGTARLTVSFAGEVLATGEARFGEYGQVRVSATLDAGPDAAARTWRYEVVAADGTVVAVLSLGTSGDATTGTATSPALPRGTYTVRQVLTADTRAACAPGAFYEVTAPAGAIATVELAGEFATASFTIRPCPDLPASLAVQVPVDTITPGLAGGVVGAPDFLPGELPINEVRGVREPGPGAANPLPPATGNTISGPVETTTLPLLLLVTGAALLSLPFAAWSAVRVAARARR